MDTTAPETVITSGPTGETPTGPVEIKFSSSEAGATFECSLDGAEFSPCDSPVQVAAPSSEHT